MNHGYFQRQLPEKLADLADLAMDLRWNNCPAAQHLWKRFDPAMWEHTENPLLVLQSAHQDQIDAAAEDEMLLQTLAECGSKCSERRSARATPRSFQRASTGHNRDSVHSLGLVHEYLWHIDQR
jgi:hypothetical protein